MRLRRLGERQECDSFAVRKTAALHQARTGKLLDELREQARLAHTGGAEESDELRRPFALDAGCDRAQHGKLLVSPDQRCGQTGHPTRRRLLLAGGRDRDPGRHGLALSLCLEGLVLAVRDRAARRRICPLAHEHVSRLRVLLQARGHVDGVAADHQLAAGRRFPACDHFTRVDADPEPNIGAVATLHTVDERHEAVPRGQPCPNSPLRVVFVGLGDAEHGEDRVAGEFLRRASEPLDLGVDQLEELSLNLADILRIQPLAECGGAGEVCEQDGDDPPLLPVVSSVGSATSVLAQCDAAGGAEGRAGRLLRAAGRAGPLERRAALTAKTGAGRVLRAARGAGQFHAASLRRGAFEA